MVLSAKILTDANSVNSFDYTDRYNTTQGNPFTLYLQLFDTDQGLRYVPASGATLSVVLYNLDTAKRVTRFATQPYPGDLSIWSVSVLATDPLLAGTVNVKLTLVEGGVTRWGFVANAIAVSPQGL